MSLVRLRLHAAVGLAVLATAITACGTSSSAPSGTPAPGTTLTVVASTNVYGAVAQAIGGDRVQVRSLITDPTGDPHSYESTPADAAAVAGAAVFVFNGGGYDGFAPKLVAAAGTGPVAIDVAELSGLEAATPAGEVFNEHVWYSLPTMVKLADRLAADLGKAAPADAATFTANAAGFITKIAALTAKLDAIKTKHGAARVAITEPVPVYVIDAAGLTNVTPEAFAEAVEEDTDPPAAVLAETLALFGPDPVRVLVLNAQTQTPTTDQVKQAAIAAGVPVVEVSETLPAGASDYVSWMGGQIDALAAALETG